MMRTLVVACCALGAPALCRGEPFHDVGRAVVEPYLAHEFKLDGDPGRVHVDGLRVYVESGGSLFAFDLACDKLLWEARDAIRASLPGFEGNHPDAGRVRRVDLASGENVIVPGPDGVIAFDRRSGQVRWRHLVADGVRTRFPVDDGKVYVASSGKVEVLGLRDGELLASHALDGDEQSRPAPALGRGLLCFGPRALRLTGESAWLVDMASGLMGETVSANGLAYFTTNHGQNALFAVESATGRMRFRFAPATDDVPMGILPAPVVTGAHLLVSYFDEEGGATNTLYALDPRTGEERWRTALPAVVSRQGALIGDTAYFYTWDKEILVVSCGDGRIDARFKPELEAGETSKSGLFTTVEGGQDVAGLVALEGMLLALVGREYPHDAYNQISAGSTRLNGDARLRVYRCRRNGSKAARAQLHKEADPAAVVRLLRHVDRTVSSDAAAWLAKRFGSDLGFRAARTDAEKQEIYACWLRRIG